MIRFFLLALLGLSTCANARTLFIDLNNAAEEIAVLTAATTGEIVVVPSFTRIDREARANVLSATLEALLDRAHFCAPGKPLTQPECDALYEQMRDAEIARKSATGNYSDDDLLVEIAGALRASADRPFDMLVISGHHEQGVFRGELAQLEITRLDTLLHTFAESFRAINTVMLLGCDTGTREMFVEKIGPTFAHVALIVGAESPAPVRNDPHNLAFIRKFSEQRTAFFSARTPQQAKAAYTRIRSREWPASVLWRHQVMFFRKTTESLAIHSNRFASQSVASAAE
jgi:hypothetical protein